MLSLKPLVTQTWATHPETGVRLKLNALSGKDYQELRRKSKKGGEVDPIVFAANAADKIIAEWEGVGESPDKPAECTEKNKRAFGEAFVFNIMTWAIDEAMKIESHIKEEEIEGKDS